MIASSYLFGSANMCSSSTTNAPKLGKDLSSIITAAIKMHIRQSAGMCGWLSVREQRQRFASVVTVGGSTLYDQMQGHLSQGSFLQEQ